ncbi:MAG: cytochrome ubiquinol oxidase subunit I [Raoultibacter sp.]
MELFADIAFLSRLQFALTVAFHFIFVPLSIGLGLILAINETRYYKSKSPEDSAATRFWVKIFTATFVVGVATGITMEFSFGTNWADYSRFVGDIFGAPLAAEALLAFFLESVFLGVLVFGRKRVSQKFYLVSAWLVWFGSCLSGLWILIANSWMQTPAGAELAADGSKAVITDFLAAAFNPSILSRYSHVITALLIMGAFLSIAVAAWYLKKGKHADFAMKTMKTGAVVALITTGLMIFSAHSSAVLVSVEQPTKLAMMEGQYTSEKMPLYAFGWVDQENQKVITPFAIPGGTSMLASGSFDTVYPGLNELANGQYGDDFTPETVADLPVNFVFQSYHLMVAMFGLIALCVALALIFTWRGGKIRNMKWLQTLLLVSPIFPFIAIQTGWITAEVGRQPWVVYPSTSGPEGVSLLTNDAISQSVSAPELWITIGLFVLVYAFLFVAWVRVLSGFIKRGPVLEGPEAELAGAVPADASAAEVKVAAKTDGSANAKDGE